MGNICQFITILKSRSFLLRFWRWQMRTGKQLLFLYTQNSKLYRILSITTLRNVPAETSTRFCAQWRKNSKLGALLAEVCQCHHYETCQLKPLQDFAPSDERIANSEEAMKERQRANRRSAGWSLAAEEETACVSVCANTGLKSSLPIQTGDKDSRWCWEYPFVICDK